MDDKLQFGPFDPASFKRIMQVLEECGIRPEIEEDREELKAQEKSFVHDPLAAYSARSYAPAYLYVYLTEDEVRSLGGKLSEFGVRIYDSSEPQQSEKVEYLQDRRPKAESQGNGFLAAVIFVGLGLLLTWFFTHR